MSSNNGKHKKEDASVEPVTREQLLPVGILCQLRENGQEVSCQTKGQMKAVGP